MNQRAGGYQRKELDRYQTPAWVTAALVPHIPNIAQRHVWQPAAGGGQMVRELAKHCPNVYGSDIETGIDFLRQNNALAADAIITNPPYALERQFIEHALALTKLTTGIVAMLLRTNYDHAATHQHLFSDCNAFAKKIVLTKRIVWFDDPGATPSFNHAWYLWDWLHDGPPVLAYGPGEPASAARPLGPDLPLDLPKGAVECRRPGNTISAQDAYCCTLAHHAFCFDDRNGLPRKGRVLADEIGVMGGGPRSADMNVEY
jgi:hypothetical protein